MEVAIVGYTGSKWRVLDKQGNVIYIGKTRKSCYEKCYNMGYVIKVCSHGANEDFIKKQLQYWLRDK